MIQRTKTTNKPKASYIRKNNETDKSLATLIRQK